MSYRLTVGLGCLLCALVAQEPPAATTPSEWARQLGAARHEDREQAERELLRLGGKARSAVRRALNSDDPEVRGRAERVWKSVRWGDDPALAETAARLLVSYRAGKPKSVDKVANSLKSRTIVLAGALAYERDGPARQLVADLVRLAVCRLDAPTLARTSEQEETLPELLTEAAPKVGRDENRKIVRALNLLWHHEQAASCGLRAVQRWPDDRQLIADTLLAIRASGNMAAVSAWLAAREPDRARFVLLSHLAQESGDIACFAECVERGVPEDLGDDEIEFAADLLSREERPATAARVLAAAKSIKLRYRHYVALAALGDRPAAGTAWRTLLAATASSEELYGLANQLEASRSPKEEDVLRRLLGDRTATDVYAANAYFRLASICKERGDYAEAADLQEAGVDDKMEGAFCMTVNGKSLSQEQAKERIRNQIRELREKAQRFAWE